MGTHTEKYILQRQVTCLQSGAIHFLWNHLLVLLFCILLVLFFLINSLQMYLLSKYLEGERGDGPSMLMRKTENP